MEKSFFNFMFLLTVISCMVHAQECSKRTAVLYDPEKDLDLGCLNQIIQACDNCKGPVKIQDSSGRIYNVDHSKTCPQKSPELPLDNKVVQPPKVVVQIRQEEACIIQ